MEETTVEVIWAFIQHMVGWVGDIFGALVIAGLWLAVLILLLRAGRRDPLLWLWLALGVPVVLLLAAALSA